jgi:aminopeptidase-like protein
MIKSKEGTVKTKGATEEIRADLTCIFRALNEGGIIDGEKDVIDLYKLACMDESEIDDLIANKLKEMKEKLENIRLGDLLK